MLEFGLPEKRAITKTILEQVRLKVFSESHGHVREQYRGIYCALWRRVREILHAMSIICLRRSYKSLVKAGSLIRYW